MNRTFKYRLLANKETLSKADKWLELLRQLYNAALEERKDAWNKGRKRVKTYQQFDELVEIRKLYPEYKDINAQVLRTPIKRLDASFHLFITQLKSGKNVGLPRYKGKNRYNSFILEQNGWKLDGKYLTITNIGRFKIRLSRPIEGNIREVIIKRSLTNKWYVCFSCCELPNKVLPKINKSIGIDVGMKSLIVDSDGNKFDNKKYLKNSLNELRIRQRKLFRRIKKSNRQKDAQLQIAKYHEKVSNKRQDYLQKLANYYVCNYDFIFIEDLNVGGLVKNHHISLSVNDVSWSTFFNYLYYKAESAGRQVVKIPTFEPTSKTCSNCGAINKELKLNHRQWVCSSCGVLHDRDYNAAKNIQRVGQTQQALTCGNSQSVACESQK